MTFTVSSVRRMKPQDLATAAGQVSTANESFERSLDEVLRQAEAAHGSWTGAGADAALERARAEVTAGRRIAGHVDTVVTALNDGAARLGSARDSLLSAVDAAVAERFAVDDANWTVTDTTGNQDREQMRLSHEATIQSRLETLVAEDEAVGFAIDAAIDETTATANDVAAGRDYQPPASLAGLPPEQLQAVLNDPRFQEWVANHPDAAKPLLDAAVDAGNLPARSECYRTFLQDYWKREALEQAGIDPAKWDPAKGTEFNAETITKVYEYYGQLFLDHPDLQWAGMANMIGPSFAGGFYDLNMLKQIADKVGGNPQLKGLSSLSAQEVAWYETKFLGMQQQIFNDQASMHEAYLHGGTNEIDRMGRAGLMDENGQGAWHAIDAGIKQDDPALISKGNEMLLYREQYDIIEDDYQDMRDRPVTGPAVTYGLTAIGAPSIPGAHTFGELFPLEATVRTGLLTETHITTPLPDGNIAGFDDGWKLIQTDTLPAYQHLIGTDLAQARDIVGSDFDTRIENQRLASQADEIVGRLTDVDVDVEFKWPWER